MTLKDWEKRFTHRMFVDGEVNMGEVIGMVQDMWQDAQDEVFRAMERAADVDPGERASEKALSEKVPC